MLPVLRLQAPRAFGLGLGLGVLLLVGPSACKSKPTRPEPIVRLIGNWPNTGYLQTVTLEIAGTRGDNIAVDVPKAKLVPGLQVQMVFETPCGPKKVPFPLVMEELKPSDESQLNTFDFITRFEIPDHLPYPPKRASCSIPSSLARSSSAR